MPQNRKLLIYCQSTVAISEREDLFARIKIMRGLVSKEEEENIFGPKIFQLLIRKLYYCSAVTALASHHKTLILLYYPSPEMKSRGASINLQVLLLLLIHLLLAQFNRITRLSCFSQNY